MVPSPPPIPAARGAPWLLGIVVTLLAAGSAHAQEPEGLKLVGGLAYEPGGPGAVLEAELGAAGYDDRPYSCSSDCDFPFYHDEGLNLAMALGFRYRFVAPFVIEAILSNGQRGHAEGFSSDARGHLTLAYGTLILASTAGAYIGPIKVAAGPALNRISWDVTRDSRNAGRGVSVAPGGTVEMAMDLRAADTLFSLKVGARRFAAAGLDEAVDLPFQIDYSSFFLGFTMTRWR